MMQAPFPYFGGKSSITSLVWERLGEVDTYVEPFAGSLAVLLGAPRTARCEVVNDLDGHITNVWRAIQMDPDQVAHYANWPINEIDLQARRRVLVQERDALTKALEDDPSFFDARLAAWWVWGRGAWVGAAWPDCAHRSRPKVTHAGMGIHAESRRHALDQIMLQLSVRLRHVRVLCGDWSRCLTAHVGWIGDGHPVGVFLDPPYTRQSGRGTNEALYAREDWEVGHRVAAWAREMGEAPQWRIVLCGLADEYNMPGWQEVAWTSQGASSTADKERLWFSPHCLSPATQLQLLEGATW